MKKLMSGVLTIALMATSLSASEFIKDTNGCLHMNPEPVPNESLSWTGSCVDGFANGKGTRTWYKNGNFNENEDTELVYGTRLKWLNSASWKGSFLTMIMSIAYTNKNGFSLTTYTDTSKTKEITENDKGTVQNGVVEIRQDGKLFGTYVGEIIDGIYQHQGVFTLRDGTSMNVSHPTLKFYSTVDKKGKVFLAYEKSINDYNMIQERKAQRERDAYDVKVANFRKNIREGDDTSSGMVIQVKGNMVKVQANDSQCSQRDYKGNCSNYINTPVEKWLKRSEIYPN
jgi:hypothetical protein